MSETPDGQIGISQFWGEIAKIRELLAAHTPQIAQIPDVAKTVNLLATQQTALQGQLNALQAETLRQQAWQQNMETWRNETPSIFVPRKEHEAQGLPERVSALEQRVFSAQLEAKNAQITEKKEQISLFEQMKQHRLAVLSLVVFALLSLAGLVLSIINIVH